MSNIKNYKYDWIWDKKKAGAVGIGEFQPLRHTENISVFYKKTCLYNPQMVKRDKVRKSGNKTYTHKYPKNIIEVSNANQKGKQHPTQKPVALMEYLIKTYTNEGDLVLDFTCGSGTTLVAAEKLSRRWVGIEINEEYCKIAKNRIEDLMSLFNI